jgi:hypothetical protein
MLMIIVLAKLFFTGLYFSDNKLSNIFSYVSESQWYAIGEPEKTTYLSQVTDKLHHIMLNRVHVAIDGIQTHNFRDRMH